MKVCGLSKIDRLDYFECDCSQNGGRKKKGSSLDEFQTTSVFCYLFLINMTMSTITTRAPTPTVRSSIGSISGGGGGSVVVVGAVVVAVVVVVVGVVAVVVVVVVVSGVHSIV